MVEPDVVIWDSESITNQQSRTDSISRIRYPIFDLRNADVIAGIQSDIQELQARDTAPSKPHKELRTLNKQIAGYRSDVEDLQEKVEDIQDSLYGLRALVDECKTVAANHAGPISNEQDSELRMDIVLAEQKTVIAGLSRAMEKHEMAVSDLATRFANGFSMWTKVADQEMQNLSTSQLQMIYDFLSGVAASTVDPPCPHSLSEEVKNTTTQEDICHTCNPQAETGPIIGIDPDEIRCDHGCQAESKITDSLSFDEDSENDEVYGVQFRQMVAIIADDLIQTFQSYALLTRELCIASHTLSLRNFLRFEAISSTLSLTIEHAKQSHGYDVLPALLNFLRRPAIPLSNTQRVRRFLSHALAPGWAKLAKELHCRAVVVRTACLAARARLLKRLRRRASTVPAEHSLAPSPTVPPNGIDAPNGTFPHDGTLHMIILPKNLRKRSLDTSHDVRKRPPDPGYVQNNTTPVADVPWAKCAKGSGLQQAHPPTTLPSSDVPLAAKLLLGQLLDPSAAYDLKLNAEILR
ncbi:hypothetical protein BOTBODRAFT_181850 [Botryobasidium botryosum FD-172 SS1]|uniref:Uncharacterized protein n=1 Tax=Botryobasidium botryosum (strain FD-172 SS1) TaxID=930990 RepID=A0A067LSV3_BOTB1|nr:hypothetical protein BOTBODRAFT_181850 [Botryobasidium botryosum FD-172 SS1]